MLAETVAAGAGVAVAGIAVGGGEVGVAAGVHALKSKTKTTSPVVNIPVKLMLAFSCLCEPYLRTLGELGWRPGGLYEPPNG
jgi:hypothetical protein